MQTKPFNYCPVTPEPFYSIAPGVKADDVSNYLKVKLAHLHAMLMITWGGGGESFRECSDETQDSYMWSCSVIAEECHALFSVLMEQGRKA